MARKTRAKKTSAGLRRSIRNGVNISSTGIIDREINLISAWRKGQNPWLTIPGPDKAHEFVRVRANTYWGDFRRRPTQPTSVRDGE